MRPVGLLAVAAVSLGTIGLVTTRALVLEIPPIQVAFLRYAIAGVVLLACAPLTGASPRFALADLPPLGVGTALLFVGNPVLAAVGLTVTDASHGALMLATIPVWSCLLGRLRGAEQLNRFQVAGVALAAVGVGILIAEHGIAASASPMAALGDLSLLASALCAAGYGIVVKPYLGRYGPVPVATYGMAWGGLLMLPLALWSGLPETLARADGRLLWLLLLIGVVGTAMALLLWTCALSRLTPTQVAVYLNLQPIFAVGLGAVLLAEWPSAGFGVSLAVVGVGVLLANSRPTATPMVAVAPSRP